MKVKTMEQIVRTFWQELLQKLHPLPSPPLLPSLPGSQMPENCRISVPGNAIHKSIVLIRISTAHGKFSQVLMWFLKSYMPGKS